MRNRLIIVLLLAVCWGTAKADDLKMWYRQPAKVWTEALPLGNSHVGAMVYGGVVNEEIQLNEETLWGGGPHRNDSPKALNVLPQVRELEHAEYTDYRRELDLEKAIASVLYKIGEVTYIRTFFTSLADNALMIQTK